MDVIIDHELRFSPPAALLEPLRRRVSWPNPERALVARRGRPYHHIPAEWCALEYSPGNAQARLPRGLLAQLREAAREAGVPITWKPRVTWDRDAARIPLAELGAPLRDYQAESVQACAENLQGVVVLPCGGGKTYVGSTLVLHLNQRSVVVAPSIAIADQWVETLRRIKPDAKIREVHGSTTWTDGPLAPGEIAVGVDDSLAQPKACQILASAGVLVTDETHRVASKTWRSIVSACPARWRIGFTATPERADGWDVLLPCLLGPVLLQREQQWLVQRGYLAQPTIFPIDTGVEVSSADYARSVPCSACKRPLALKAEDETKLRVGLLKCSNKVKVGRRYDVCNGKFAPGTPVERTFSVGKAGSRVAADPERVEKVRAICAWAMTRDRDVLVLTPRVSAVAGIVKALQADGVAAVGLTGSENRGTRTRVLAEVRRRVHRVLVATQLADEGLDLPRMDTLINTSAGKAAGNAAQRVGRVCRPDGNEPLVFDFVDGGDAFRRQWQARSLAYRRSYGEISVPSKKPIPLRDVLAMLNPGGTPESMFKAT